MTPSSVHPNPAHFLRAGWRAVSRVPGAVLARGAFEAFAYAYRMLGLFLIGLAFVAHLGIHIKFGLGVGSWPGALLETLRDPATFVGFAGVVFTAWLVLFALESLTYGGLWGAVRESMLNKEVAPWTSVLRGAVEWFPRALQARLLVRLTEVTLLSVTVGFMVATVSLARAVGGWFDSPILAPSLTFATLLTAAGAAAVVLRLSAEIVAAPLFLDDVGLGEAIVRAAQTVLTHPVYIYRLFVVAAGVLIPPLLIAWGAAILQNLAFSVGAEPIALLLRIVAELSIVVGLAAFSIMLQATFFAYYTWENRLMNPSELVPSRRSVSLADLLPERQDNIVDVDTVLGEWPAEALIEGHVPPKTPGPGPSEPFNLGAILVTDEEE